MTETYQTPRKGPIIDSQFYDSSLSQAYSPLKAQLQLLEKKSPGLGYHIAMLEARKQGILPEKGTKDHNLFTKNPIEYISAKAPSKESKLEDEDVLSLAVLEALQELRQNAQNSRFRN